MSDFKCSSEGSEVVAGDPFTLSKTNTKSAASRSKSSSPASCSSGSPELPSSSEENSKRRNAALKFPPCVICGGKASGLHYGCNTCEACKNFFRRYLIRKNGYICPKQNDCYVSYTNKSNCSACRLGKCLGLGMCKTKSKLGRYSYSRRTETIKKVKQLERYEENEPPAKENCISEIDTLKVHATSSSNTMKDGTTDCTNYNEDLVNMLTAGMDDIKIYEEELQSEEVRNAKFKQHYENFMLKVKMFGSMNAVSMEEYQTLLRNYGIDIDGQYEACVRLSGVYEGIVNRYCDYAKKMPGFSQLNYHDQSNLLKSTHCLAFTIMMHQGYSEKYNVFLEVNGETFHVDECMDRIVSREYVIEACRSMSYLQKLKLTKEEMAILVAICTFSGDCCKLENPELVEKIQFDFVELLSQYLHASMDKQAASRRFIKLFDTLVRIRNVANIYCKEMKEFKNDKFLMEALPFLAELVPNDD